MKRNAASAVLLSAFVAGGCYSFTAVTAPEPGMDVRARLTTEAAVRRSQGRDEPIMRMDGTVVGASAASLSLDILVARTSGPVQDIVIRDTVQLERAEIQSLLARKFSPVKTALFVVGAGAAAFGIVKGIDQVTGGTGEGNDPGDPTFRAALISVFGFRQLRFGSVR